MQFLHALLDPEHNRINDVADRVCTIVHGRFGALQSPLPFLHLVAVKKQFL